MTLSKQSIWPVAGWKQLTILVLILTAISSFLYFNTLHYDFLKDDYRLIVENPRVKDFNTFIDSMDQQFFAFPDFPYLHYWRPMTLFSFYLDYRLWGLDPQGYHLTNILLNTLNVLLVLLIFYFLTGRAIESFIIALLFSLHPTHVEAVAWISGRTDLLAAGFSLGFILAFLLFLRKKKIYYYILSIILFLPALLSKENTALLPLAAAIMVLAVLPKEEKRLKKLLFIVPLFIMDIIYILVHSHFTGASKTALEFSFGHIPVIFKTIGVYTHFILFPKLRAPYFPMPGLDRPNLLYYLLFAVGILIIAGIIYARKKFPASFFSLIFIIFLLPLLDPLLVPSHPQVALRFVYIPSIFMGVFFTEIFGIYRKKIPLYVTVVLLSAVVLVCTWKVHRFKPFFKDDANHYGRLIKHFPDDGSISLPMALRKAGHGKYGEALTLVNGTLEAGKTDRWRDDSEMGSLLKANLLVLSGQPEQGKALAEDILGQTEKKEMRYFAFLVLAKYHQERREYGEALTMLKKAQAIGETPDLLYRMSVVSMQLNETGPALEYLEKAKHLNPQLPRYDALKQYILNRQQGAK